MTITDDPDVRAFARRDRAFVAHVLTLLGGVVATVAAPFLAMPAIGIAGGVIIAVSGAAAFVAGRSVVMPKSSLVAGQVPDGAGRAMGVVLVLVGIGVAVVYGTMWTVVAGR